MSCHHNHHNHNHHHKTQCYKKCCPKYPRELVNLLAQIHTFDKQRKFRYIPERPDSLGPPPIPFPDQYEIGQTYPWNSPIIPAETNTSAPGTPNEDGYNKFLSIAYYIHFYAGLNPFTLQPTDPSVAVFLLNRRDRGPDNYRKKVYMHGLTCPIMEKYKDKIDTFLNDAFSGFTTYALPVLSSFRSKLIRFFLALHIGYDNYPQYVLDYFDTFSDLIGSAGQPFPNEDQVLLDGHILSAKIKEYFAERGNVVIQNNDETSLVYWWNEAGLDLSGIITEVLHNIIAFLQYANTLYLLIVDKVNGTPVPFPPGAIKYDFFQKFKDAADEKEEMNVVRELYRLLTPNTTDFSDVTQATPDVPPVVIQSRHLRKLIMINNTGPAYFNYNPTQYNPDFQTDFVNDCGQCPFNNSQITDNLNPEECFKNSSVDGETLVDKSNEKMFPVYPLPKYAPFGLGYRRCAGEVLNYFFTIKMLDKFKDLDWEFRAITPDTGKVALAPFAIIDDNIYYKPTL